MGARARKSVLYRGRVRHTRMQPHHQFEYRIYYGLFDIDELDELDRDLRLFSVDRWNLLGMSRADHGPADGSPLRPWAETLLAQAGVDLAGGRILLLALPRVLGYVFNPISVWYCYGADGHLHAVLHEVRNTFGDRHTYVVPISGSDGPLHHQTDKAMHVSPFHGMDQTYHFAMSPPDEQLGLRITQREDDRTVLVASLRLRRLALTDANLLRLFLTTPLVTLKAIVGIHWQALRLWRKGAPFHRRPGPPAADHSVVAAGSGAP